MRSFNILKRMVHIITTTGKGRAHAEITWEWCDENISRDKRRSKRRMINVEIIRRELSQRTLGYSENTSRSNSRDFYTECNYNSIEIELMRVQIEVKRQEIWNLCLSAREIEMDATKLIWKRNESHGEGGGVRDVRIMYQTWHVHVSVHFQPNFRTWSIETSLPTAEKSYE
jgi:hypothetical protein